MYIGGVLAVVKEIMKLSIEHFATSMKIDGWVFVEVHKWFCVCQLNEQLAIVGTCH